MCIVIKTWLTQKPPTASEISQLKHDSLKSRPQLQKYCKQNLQQRNITNWCSLLTICQIMNKSNLFLIMIMIPSRINPTYLHTKGNSQ
jgi:hypothetical protein